MKEPDLLQISFLIKYLKQKMPKKFIFYHPCRQSPTHFPLISPFFGEKMPITSQRPTKRFLVVLFSLCFPLVTLPPLSLPLPPLLSLFLEERWHQHPQLVRTILDSSKHQVSSTPLLFSFCESNNNNNKNGIGLSSAQ